VPPESERTRFRDGGWLVVNPDAAARLQALGLAAPADFLQAAGEIVSGHPDRHVRRIRPAGSNVAFYLKRQHVVTRRERWRNWRAGFGWVSRSEREAIVLQQLEAKKLAAPRWAAFGEDGKGRAFLLVEELKGTMDLRRFLSSASHSQAERRRVAIRLGGMIGRYHRAGFVLSEFTAKHLLVSSATGEITPIDWQNARQVSRVSRGQFIRSLAALNASVSTGLATARDRLRTLKEALAESKGEKAAEGELAELARHVRQESGRIVHRRSLRDQREARHETPRLVWLANEEVCAIAEVAAIWPDPPVAPPFYGEEPGGCTIRLRSGEPAHLIRGRAVAPLARLAARLRSRSWRSPGVVQGRILFHLERYRIPAVRLLAFGQRLTGCAGAEWFVLHTSPPPPLSELTPRLAAQLGGLLRQLHEAGCRPVGDPLSPYGEAGVATIRNAGSIRLAKSITKRNRARDIDRLAGAIEPKLRPAIVASYWDKTPCVSLADQRMPLLGAST